VGNEVPEVAWFMARSRGEWRENKGKEVQGYFAALQLSSFKNRVRPH